MTRPRWRPGPDAPWPRYYQWETLLYRQKSPRHKVEQYLGRGAWVWTSAWLSKRIPHISPTRFEKLRRQFDKDYEAWRKAGSPGEDRFALFGEAIRYNLVLRPPNDPAEYEPPKTAKARARIGKSPKKSASRACARTRARAKTNHGKAG